MKGEYILSPAAAWAISQIMKTVIFAIRNKKLDWSRLIGDGGMPSCHSATVSALAMTSLLSFGFFSFEFAISVVLAFVVMHDAFGIRLESGKQAKAINDLHDRLQSLINMQREERLEELLGHSPFQVLIGAITGIAVAVLIHFI